MQQRRMTRDEKRMLAQLVMGRIADIAEFLDEFLNEAAGTGIPLEARYDAARTLGKWAYTLPTGDYWDTRLIEPEI